MLSLQNALTDWFKQFTPNVYISGEDRLEDGGMDFNKMPLITFSYATSDFDENTMMSFDIWSYSTNWIEALSIETKIAKALPSQSNELFEIKGGTVYEYRNPSTGIWIEFDLADVQRITQEIWGQFGQKLEVREAAGESIGGIVLRRGSPFMQSVPDPNFLVKRRMGNIVIKSFLIY